MRLLNYFYVEQYKTFTDVCSRVQILPVSQIMTVPKQVLLPDLFAVTPFKSGINPHYHQVAAESSAWITSFDILSRNRRVVSSLNHSELLAAYVYPCVFHSYELCSYLFSLIFLYPTRYANPEQLRIACDFVEPLSSSGLPLEPHNQNVRLICSSSLMKSVMTKMAKALRRLEVCSYL